MSSRTYGERNWQRDPLANNYEHLMNCAECTTHLPSDHGHKISSCRVLTSFQNGESTPPTTPSRKQSVDEVNFPAPKTNLAATTEMRCSDDTKSRTDGPLKRRALLYSTSCESLDPWFDFGAAADPLVPASSAKMRQKTHSLSVDFAVFDMEDSVADNQKSTARNELRDFLNGPRPTGAAEIGVRINGVDTQHVLADLAELKLPTRNLETIIVPKINSASDLHFINEVIHHVRKQPVRVIAMIETARGIVNIKEICEASPYLSGLIFAAEDYSRDVGITRTEGLTELLHARSTIVAHARAFKISSVIDLACTAFKGKEGKATPAAQVLAGRNLGFTGKQCLHPDQIDIVQRGFEPSEGELEWAVRVGIASEKATERGQGAWSLDGKVVNIAVTARAKAILEKAMEVDMDTTHLEARWAGQEPE